MNYKIYSGKKVLVTGGTGMIGKFLVNKLVKIGASVKIVSMDDASRANPDAEFYRADLTNFENCIEVCKNVDYIFHLAGIKGSPKVIQEQPATFFESMILFNTNMLRAARKNKNLERYLYTSSVGVYSPFKPDGSPAEVFYEDDVWQTFPSINDKAPGWAKRMGELQCESVEKENPEIKFSIVRPANVYGPGDNFNPKNSMVIPSIVKRALDGENPLIVWGDGSQVRDFIYADDVATGMLVTMEKSPGSCYPINLGYGKGYTIYELVQKITDNLEIKPVIKWDTSKPVGDKKRILDISRAEKLGWKPEINLEDGIKMTMDWYIENKNNLNKGYNVFD